MRRAARRDANEPQVIIALQAAGATVEQISSGGIPDLLVGYRGRNWLLEVKDGNKPPSERKLTPDQVKFHENWRGQRAVVESPEQALQAIGVLAADGATMRVQS